MYAPGFALFRTARIFEVVRSGGNNSALKAERKVAVLA
jgi:hypothetical protein